MIHDRLINGAIAGGVGAVIQNGYTLLMRSLGYLGPSFIDYGKVVIFYELPQGWLPTGLGLIAHFIWDVVLAIIFAYLLYGTTSRYVWFKGVIYGIVIWFFIQLGAILYKVPLIVEFTPTTVAFCFGGAVMFGIIITLVLNYLDQPMVEV